MLCMMICVTIRRAPFDPCSIVNFLLQVRCFSAIVTIVFFGLLFLQHCGTSEPSSPLLLMERLSFEMHKTYTETRLQLHLSPATIVLVDGNEVSKQSKVKPCKQCKKKEYHVV